MKMRIFKRIISLLLALTLILPFSSCFHDNWNIPEREELDFDLGALLGITDIPIDGEETMPNGIVLTLSDDGSFYIVSDASKCEAEKVTIPKSYKGIPIKEIARGAFAELETLVKINIPSSVVNIGKDAFTGCDNLKYSLYEGAKYLGNDENPHHALIEFTDTAISSPAIHEETRMISAGACKNINAQNFKKIVIPDSVVSVCDAAFEMCSNVHTLVIGNGVETIGDSAFLQLVNLTDLTVGESVKSIGRMAFYNASSLETLVLPDSVTEIGDSAFYSCDSLRKADLGDGVKIISEGAFEKCTSLEWVDLGKSLESLGEQAFAGTALTSVSLPHTLEYIGKGAFEDCPDSLFQSFGRGLYLGNSENQYEYLVGIDDGNAYDPISSGLLSITLTLHPDTRRIASAMLRSYSIYSLQISGVGKHLTVKNNCIIDKNEKKLIAGISGATIPDDGSVTSIGDDAFYGIEGLALTSIPKSVTHIGDYAFAYSTGISKLTVEGPASIGNYAFFNCSDITEVFFEEQISSIGDSAFDSCGSLLTVDVPDSVTYLGKRAFAGCLNLSQVYIGSRVEVIRENTFSTCISLKSVRIGGDIKAIKSAAFSGCKSLQSFDFKEGLEYIGDYAFEACKSLKKVYLPESLEEIGDLAFNMCTGLKNVSLGTGLKKVGNYVFEAIPSYAEIVYGGTVSMWSLIENANNLCGYSGEFTVICTDGEIVLEPDPISVELD